MRIRNFASAIVLVALTLTACGAQPDANPVVSDFASQEVTWGNCDSELFISSDYVDDGFKKGDVQCAEIAVPLVYGQSGTESLTLTLMKDPADGDAADYQGALFSNPGGPGQSGIDYIQSVPLPASIRSAFDIIGFDPRGVGASSPIRCSDELDLRSYYEWPFDVRNQSEADAASAAEEAFNEDCEQRNPNWWAVSTTAVVDDLELMRDLLTGEEPLNFIGHSYGTVLAARYITTYPDRVGRIVLDSPVTSERETIQARLDAAYAMVDARDRIFFKCAQDPECEGDTIEEVQQRLLWARDEVLADRMDGFVDDTKGAGFFQSGNGESAYLILHAIDALTYWPLADAYDAFKQIYSDLANGWYGGFEYIGLYQDGYDPDNGLSRDNSYEILNIVNCLDIDSRDTRAADVIERERIQLEKADPFETEFYSLYDFEPAPEAKPGCYWTWRAYEEDSIPDPPAKAAPFTNSSGVAALVIGSKGDNVTPYPWSQQVAEDLKSPLLTYEGTGHSVLWSNHSCIDDKVTDFLLTGKPQPATSCAADEN